MTGAALAHGLLNLATGRWLTGPIFDKELRVAARHRLTYVLRSLYLAVVIVVLGLWAATVVHDLSMQSNALRLARISELGRTLSAIVVWMQFLAAQVLAGVLLCTAISGEVNRRTLGVLLTTPITSLQVVVGKLLGALTQVFILIGLSVPVLAIVRVFGGVPWDFVIGGVCVTLTTALLIGSLTLLFSILFRHAYVVILMTVMTCLNFFLLLPMLMVMFMVRPGNGQVFVEILSLSHPYFVVGSLTQLLFDPRAAMTFPGRFPAHWIWPLHTVASLAFTLGLIALCTVLVRRAALKQMVGGTNAANGDSASPGRRRLRRIWGPPMLWKELHPRTFGRRPVLTGIGLLLMSVGLMAMYFYYATSEYEDFSDEYVHVVFGMIYFWLALLCTAIYAAIPIAAEKENRTWPAILTTTLPDEAILWAKVAGVARRSAPVWAMLLGHVFVFVLLGYIHPVALLQIPWLVFWCWAVITGAGLYFSTRFCRTTPAVVLNLVFFALLWIGLPFFFGMLSVAGGGSGDWVEWCLDSMPWWHLGSGLNATADGGWHSSLDYDWEFWRFDDVWGSTLWMLVVGGLNVLLGYCFLRTAGRRLRQNVF